MELSLAIAKVITAGLCMGLATIGPAIGQGYIGGKACESIGKRPESASMVKQAMYAALIAVETSALYALVISLILLFS